MELSYFINMIIIFVLNVLFFFSGICLNSLVILSFWRSSQLRKKLCYFMIMVLSYCNLAAVLTNNPMAVLIAAFYLTETLDVHASSGCMLLHGIQIHFLVSLCSHFWS